MRLNISCVMLFALVACVGLLTGAIAHADSVSGAAGTARYYVTSSPGEGDGYRGTLAMGDYRTWVVTLTNIDGSGVTGNQTYQLAVQDHGFGTSYEPQFTTQVHHGFYGAGGHLLQSDEFFTVMSSHGFNPGDVPGLYDLRIVMTRISSGANLGKWSIAPYFRLPAGNWTAFFGGPWVSASAGNITKGRVIVQIDGGGGGTLIFDAPTAYPMNPCMDTYVDDDWVGLADGTQVSFLGDPNPHFIGIDAFDTVVEAVGVVCENGTVHVASGSYPEMVSITKGLSLLGAGAGTTLLDVSANASAGTVVTITGVANNVTVDGFSFITGPASTVVSNAVQITAVGATATVTVSNNVLQCVQSPAGTAKDNFGLIAGYGSDGALVFDHNTVYGGGSNPVLLELWRGPATLSYNTIYRGPDDTDASDPVFMMNYGVTNVTAKQKIDHNTIDMGGGTIYDSAHRGSGISVVAQYTGGAGPGGYTDMEITNNEIVNLKTARRGLGLWDNSSGPGDIVALIEGNMISAAPGYTAEFGIRLLGGVTGTQVLDNTVSGVEMGFQARAWNGFAPVAFVVNGNEFTACGVGVSVDAGAGVVNYNTIAGNTTGLANMTATTLDATCNWWGDILGPNVPPANPSPGDDLFGLAVYAPWLDGPGGTCSEYGSNYVSADPTGLCLNPADLCVAVPVLFTRGDTSPARGISVTIQLSANLELCDTNPLNLGVNFHQGTWLAGYGATFQVYSNGGGSYTIDQAILGTPCGVTTGGDLFTVDVAANALALPDDVGTITVTGMMVRDCNNAPLPGIPGPAVNLTIDSSVPAAITALTAVQDKTANGSDGLTNIDLSWTGGSEPDATIEIYRKEFGSYPEYDDTPGTGAPAVPSYPPAGWALVATLPSGTASYSDQPLARDFWYYVAFVLDECNVSAVSNRTNGTLDYHLGDVSDGGTPGAGDNLVDLPDISLLGGHYGISLIYGDTYNYLDVGPTTDYSVNARPTTDNKVQFEDLMMFAINYGTVSKPLPRLTAADRNALVVDLSGSATEIQAVLTLASDGAVQGVSVPLRWNADVVEPVAYAAGAWADRQAGRTLVLSPEAGVIDAAVFGATFSGEGELAIVTFRVTGPGDPGIGLGEVVARDGENRPVALGVDVTGRDLPVTPTVTRLLPLAPNPFLGSTQIRFALSEPGEAVVRVYGVDGRLVRTLIDATLPAGEKSVTWDGRDEMGRTVAAGSYLVRFQATGKTESLRVMKLR